MSRRKALLIFILSLFVVAACQTNPEAEVVTRLTATGGEAAEADIANSDVDDNAVVNNLPATQAQERLIIRTGNLSIVVEDTEETLAEIIVLAEGSGGWVVSSNVSRFSEGAMRGQITVRIPAQGFDQAMDAIKAMALETTGESTSGDDVTEEYVDLTSRLSNLEATAARVRNFLDETKNVEEALAVNAELSRLEEQIEVIKGRMQYLEQSAAFSTITVNIIPDELSQPIELAGWRPQGIAREAFEALIGALRGLAKILIWAVILLLPLILIIGTPFWLIIRFAVRRRRSRATTSASE